MFDTIESKITFEIPTNLDLDILTNNYTLLFSEMDTLTTLADKQASVGGGSVMGDDEYNRFIGDVWVGIILTLMIISSVFCMCACFLYHKFRQWKRSGEFYKLIKLVLINYCNNFLFDLIYFFKRVTGLSTEIINTLLSKMFLF